jgi:DNA invertase Pin-like site-specific DNA recombinase
MARKSRKTYRENLYAEQALVEPIIESVKVPTVLYCRLSKADEITGRESMTSQLDILRQFATNMEELEVVEEFLDDGFSGTNYNRPHYEKMMDGVRDGIYKCIIVKDLSRLGRSYLETSDLLEMELPLYGCRFISVNDRIDTDVTPIDTILVGLKNIINQKFAEDISKKIKTQFRERAKKGEMLGGPVPYGYMRNPEDKGYFLIDEEAAEVVRHVFELKISGMNDAEIARTLDAEGIITPKQYHDLKMKGVEPTEQKHWNPDTIRTMTMNQVYLGHIFHGKFKEKQFIGQKDRKNKRKDWVLYENVNPAIISQETFDKAKEARDLLYRGDLKRWNKK